MLLNCGVGEDSWESLGLQGVPTSPPLKEISPECSLEGLMLKLKRQYFGHLMWRTNSFEKTPMREKLKAGEGYKRGWDGWMASPIQWTWVWVNSGSWWWIGRSGMLWSMGSQRVGHDWATELNWIFHSVYVPHLPYPFNCRRTSRLLLCPYYCKQCCSEHWGTCIFFNSGFLSVHAPQWDCWVIWQFYYQFFKEFPHCSP